MMEDSTSSRPWASLYAHCNTLAKWHTHEHHDILRPTINGQKVGNGSIPGNPHPFLDKDGIILYSLVYEITQSIKTTPISWTSCLMRWSTLCLWSVSPWINLLSLYFGLPFNPFQYEAKNPHVAIPGTHLRPRTWPSSCAPLLCYNRTLQIYEKPLDCTL